MKVLWSVLRKKKYIYQGLAYSCPLTFKNLGGLISKTKSWLNQNIKLLASWRHHCRCIVEENKHTFLALRLFNDFLNITFIYTRVGTHQKKFKLFYDFLNIIFIYTNVDSHLIFLKPQTNSQSPLQIQASCTFFKKFTFLLPHCQPIELKLTHFSPKLPRFPPKKPKNI